MIVSKPSSMFEDPKDEEEVVIILVINHKHLRPITCMLVANYHIILIKKRRYIVDYGVYNELKEQHSDLMLYPIFPYNAVPFISHIQSDIKFLVLQYGADSDEYVACLKAHPEVVVISMAGKIIN